MNRRSKLEIHFEVLRVLEKGVKKPTRIMYKANLSWSSLQDAFDTLINSGLVTVKDRKSSRRYFITEKGRRALSYHIMSLEGLVKVRQMFVT